MNEQRGENTERRERVVLDKRERGGDKLERDTERQRDRRRDRLGRIERRVCRGREWWSAGLRRRIEFKTVFSVGDGWSRQARRGGEVRIEVREVM